jgi:hypothetical protein
VFCALDHSGLVLLEIELALRIADAYPVTPEHSQVIPRRHQSSRPHRSRRRRGEGEGNAGGQGFGAVSLVRTPAG